MQEILLVGGTGLIGGTAALHLQALGHEVTLLARAAPKVASLATLPFLPGNYAEEDWTDGRLEGFDTLVFAAGGDIRHVPTDGSMSQDEFFMRYNAEAIPRFFEAARAAGIRRAIQVGTFYPHVAPEKAATSAYVRSRKLADERTRAIISAGFEVCSLNPPVVLGHLPGLEIAYQRYMCQYARGRLEGVPMFASPGGVNHISARSLAQAVAGAVAKGEPGRAYLVGDENLSFKEYLELWCRLAGNPQTLEVRDEEHPLFPDMILYAGRGATVSYEPEGVDELGYSRHQVADTIRQILEAYD